MTYISVRNGKFRLVFPSSDTKKYIWITALPDLDKIKQIRAELLENAPHTEAELKTFRKKYKKPPVYPTVEKFIHRTPKGKYILQRKDIHYGSYDTQEEAHNIKEQLIKNNWNKELVNIKRQRNNNHKDRYIHQDPYSKKYMIRKFEKIDGKRKNITFESAISTLEEARKIRDQWEQIGWNWEDIELIN